MNQTSCLINDEGHKYMDTFDTFPFDVRKRLQNSTFNLCSFCVVDFGYAFGDLHIAIEYMEGTLQGKDMNRFIENTFNQNTNRYYDPYSNNYMPKYFDDREYKIKRDWYTQKIEKYDDSYHIPINTKDKLYGF